MPVNHVHPTVPAVPVKNVSPVLQGMDLMQSKLAVPIVPPSILSVLHASVVSARLVLMGSELMGQGMLVNPVHLLVFPATVASVQNANHNMDSAQQGIVVKLVQQLMITARHVGMMFAHHVLMGLLLVQMVALVLLAQHWMDAYSVNTFKTL